MAIVTFSDFPAGFPAPDNLAILKSLLSVDGAVTADAALIHAAGTIIEPGRLSWQEGTQTFFDVDIEGSFAYGPLGTVTGTVTGITVRYEGAALVTLSGLTGDIARIWPTMLGSTAADALLLAGNDTITGSALGGFVQGYDGNDTIFGRGAWNALFGGDGNDIIYGNDGDDSILGGAGFDRVFGGDGNDHIDGGLGRDVLRGGQGDDKIQGGAGNDKILGRGGDDLLDGQGDNDKLIAGTGDDIIYGRQGNDVLKGGAGNDKMDAGKGDDRITGGPGDDTFLFSYFQNAGSNGRDTVTDFSAGDTLVFSGFKDASLLTVTQVGDDVTIGLADNLVTLLDTTLDEVQAAIELYNNYYF